MEDYVNIHGVLNHFLCQEWIEILFTAFPYHSDRGEANIHDSKETIRTYGCVWK